MEYTSNYQLPTWVETDRIQMDDFNDMTDKIDAALGEQSETLAEQATLLSAKGNCQMHFSTYVGGGTTTSKTLTFPAKPLLVMVTNPDGYCFVACRGMTRVYPHYSTGSTKIQLTWGNLSLTWNYDDTARGNMNENGVTYRVVAFLQQDA